MWREAKVKKEISSKKKKGQNRIMEVETERENKTSTLWKKCFDITDVKKGSGGSYFLTYGDYVLITFFFTS